MQLFIHGYIRRYIPCLEGPLGRHLRVTNGDCDALSDRNNWSANLWGHPTCLERSMNPEQCQYLVPGTSRDDFVSV